MDEIKILGIVGSLRKESYNRFALKTAQELVPDGAALDLIELNGIPVFNQDDERAPPASVLEFQALRTHLSAETPWLSIAC